MKHPTLPVTRITTIAENNKMAVEYNDRVKRAHAYHQQIMPERQSSPERANSRGISDELINELVRSPAMPVEDVRAIADWSVLVLRRLVKEERNRVHIYYQKT